MKKSHLLAALCALALVILANTAQAALMNPIMGLNIDGTVYNVTFHEDSFNALWDADDNGAFGGGASVFSSAPTFWGDPTGAQAATKAIIVALGNTDTTTTYPSDAFQVPFYGGDSTTALHAGIETIYSAIDSNIITDSDPLDPNYGQDDSFISYTCLFPYASFEVATVPIPAAIWLFGSGLLGMIGIARRQKAT